jgi:hypothetical protein
MGIISELKIVSDLYLIKHPKETYNNKVEKTMPAIKMCKNELQGCKTDGTISDTLRLGNKFLIK